MTSHDQETTQLYELWDDFLTEWPIERLKTMNLSEYSSVGSQDSLTIWLESRTSELGSIWGGSSFKFGIFNRRDKSVKESSKKYSYSEDYAWVKLLGETPAAAFEVVKQRIITIAEDAREGKFPDLNERKLWPLVELKLAFLYQPRNSPIVIPTYDESYIKAFLGIPRNHHKGDFETLNSLLIEKLDQQDLLDYSRKVWEEGKRRADATIFTAEEAESELERIWSRIEEPSQYLAGFEAPSGRQVAIERTLRAVQLFTEPFDLSITGAKLIKTHTTDSPRNSNLQSQAPNLSVGNPAQVIQLSNRDALDKFVQLYEAEELRSMPNPTSSPTEETEMVRYRGPLNQIFYGPPGTGKTFHTINEAIAILDPSLDQANLSREIIKARFDEYKERGRIGFVTFHQSFSYEDFVEGLRANTEDGQISYAVEDGVFKRICDTARARSVSSFNAQPINLTGRTVWKMSLGNTLGDDAYIYDDCIRDSVLRLGYGHALDYSGADSIEKVREVHRQAGIEITDSDYSVKSTHYFVNEMATGDLVVISDGNHKFRAIAEITGEYKFESDRHDHYKQARSVTWLTKLNPSIPVDQLLSKVFSQQTLYKISSSIIKTEMLHEFVANSPATESYPIKPGDQFNGYFVDHVSDEIVRLRKPNGARLAFDRLLLDELSSLVRQRRITLADIKDKRVFDLVPDSLLEKYIVNGYNNVLQYLVEALINGSTNKPTKHKSATDPYVLIIDEINRGNIANIFGELITLIEDSKRLGSDEALEVTLPYSKETFSVPSNLYIIGTMNTADRSLIYMDTALRRRFEFRPMLPNLEVLRDTPEIEGINIVQMLAALNERIAVLFDQDHTLGHSFFMSLNRPQATIKDLARIFDRKILPLLEEYFFEDWGKIRWILGDNRKAEAHQFIRPRQKSQYLLMLEADGLFPNGGESYERNPDALHYPETYLGIYR